MLALSTPVLAAIPADDISAVVFVYQHIGEDSVPQANISIEQFQSHLQELQTDDYNILPLSKIVTAIKNGESLPPRTIAITFDGAYLSTLTQALPLLDAADIPYTVFFTSDTADNGTAGHASWGQLKKLGKQKNVELGILPATYAHLVDLPPEESATLINRAVSRYREEFEEPPLFFSYPYGEISPALKKQISGYGFHAAFGQHSGVMFTASINHTAGVTYAGTDFMAVPRFTMTGAFSDIERFQLTANALPLPVADVMPDDMILQQNPPIIGFTVTPNITDLSKLSCFISGIGKVPLTKLGGNRVEIRLDGHILEGRRTRVNCTLPNDTRVPGERQSWRWFGFLLVSPDYPDDEDTLEIKADTP